MENLKFDLNDMNTTTESIVYDKNSNSLNDVPISEFEDELASDINDIVSFINSDVKNANEILVNDSIIVLFAINKPDEAWDIIGQFTELVDIYKIFNSKKFVINKYRSDIYRKLYELSKIDEPLYRYFEVISGKLNNLEYWKSVFENKTVTEKLTILSQSFMGVSPLDPNVGLIEPSAEVNELIFDGLTENEKLDDFIVGNNVSILFTPDKIIEFIMNNNFESKNYPTLLNIAFSINPELPNFFEFAYNLIKENISVINIDSIKKFSAYIKDPYVCKNIACAKTNVECEDNAEGKALLSMIINSDIIITNPNYVTSKIRDVINAEHIDLSWYDYNMSRVPALATVDLLSLNTIDYNISYTVGYLCVFDILKNVVYVNGNIYTYDEFKSIYESKIDDFKLGSLSSNRDEAILKLVNNDIDKYNEICHTIYNFARKTGLCERYYSYLYNDEMFNYEELENECKNEEF